jgi:hypothetical protein
MVQKIRSRTYNSAHVKLAMLKQHCVNRVKQLWSLNMRNYLLVHGADLKTIFIFLNIFT